ncbi:glycosyltransferase family 2 protein [Paenibacillus sp. Marseille-Q4541]|uniref:tetratricopeptide repeat-containing glycosyltransferase family 2 protein n=1 Tax=Paenibacillus sp. Marseille-Q4541 TaxID=2831522 RepID=UPI001BA61050|nr:glycosyltransferase family 2 protein [Paenibacillus sp. Marseille-Q4541]
MNPDSPLSLCMIVRDEELVLSQCLSSVADVVSEIIIIDTGSSDATLSIAQKYGAHIISYSWRSDFAEARNESLKFATKPWILVLDADECFAAGQKEQLNGLFADETAAGYELKIRSLLGNRGDEQVTDYVCRLFRNDPEIQFRGSIHEEVASAVQSVPDKQLKRCDLEVIHYGYLNKIIERKNKTERNLRLIKEALASDPKNKELLYALGTEYFQQADYSHALPILEPLLAMVPVTAGYASDLFLKTMFALRETGRASEALDLMEQGLSAFPDFADLQELYAVILMDEGRDAEALEVLAAMRISSEYTSVSGAGTYRTSYLKGILHERQGEWAKACEAYEDSLRVSPDYVPAWQRWLPLIVCTSQMHRINEWVSREGIPEKVQSLVFYLMLDLQELAWILRQRHHLQAAFLNEPWIEALLLAQLGEYSVAVRLIQPWVQSPGDRVQTELYHAAFQYNQAVLKSRKGNNIQMSPETPLLHRFPSAAEACAVLIRIGAWDGFTAMLLSDPSPAVLLSHLSPAMKMALLQSPLYVVELLCSLLEQKLQLGQLNEAEGSRCYMLLLALQTRLTQKEEALSSAPNHKFLQKLQELQEGYLPEHAAMKACYGWNAFSHTGFTPPQNASLHPLVIF